MANASLPAATIGDATGREELDEAEPGLPPHPEDRSPPATERRPTSKLAAGAILVTLAIPLVLALAVLAQPRWYPVLDNAQTELRLRDVGSSDAPLIGLGGRIGTAQHPGSHPGPISFWALWPFYQLFGAGAWAMEAASVSLHLLAMATILWIAHRRGGLPLVLGVGAALAVLTHAYGSATVIEPWNPYMPVLWWVAFLLACWSVLADDLALLPVAVLTGSFCAQTHIPYVGLVAGTTAVTVAVVVARALVRPRRVRSGPPLARWALVAAGAGAVAWLPPVIDELTHSPGNLSIIRDHFSDPPEVAIGIERGAELILLHLNPWRLLSGQQFLTGSVLPGLALLVVWAASVALAWRLRHGVLLRLHAVLGGALVLGAVSASRIFGFVWYYLVLWAWGITALMLLAVGWTMAAGLSSRLAGNARLKATRLGALSLVATIALMAVLLAVDSGRVESPAAQRSQVLGQLVAPTVDALGSVRGPGRGRDGRYLVTWVDPVHIGAHGYGLLNELERAGFDVGVISGYRAAATQHRVMDTPTAIVHMSVGPDIAVWRSKPGVREITYYDPRSPQERTEYGRLRARAVAQLEAEGLSDLVPNIDGNLFPATFDPRVPEGLKDLMVRMADLGLPFAVFVGPPSAAG
ncbi:MAG: hypothetical protein WKF43_16020 [Acidimicrobiales bacterium]